VSRAYLQSLLFSINQLSDGGDCALWSEPKGLAGVRHLTRWWNRRRKSKDGLGFPSR